VDDTTEVARAVAEYRRVEQMYESCMCGPDALESARANVARFGDPSLILGEGNG